MPEVVGDARYERRLGSDHHETDPQRVREVEEPLAGEVVVRRGTTAGSNWCTVFHPERFVRERLADGLAVVDFVPEGARGNPRQDLSLLRKASG